MPTSIEGMIVENLITGYVPKRVEAKIPVLSFYVLRKRTLSNDYTEEQKAAYEQFHNDVREPSFRHIMAEFQSRFPQAKTIVIPGGHHYCFIAQEERVYGEMRKFLLD